MSYNMQELPKYLHTAGKITVLTSLLGVFVFAVIFLLNVGAKELQKVEAQAGNATTSITVLNTPPAWTVDAEEESGSSTTTPTNSGDEVSWVGTGTDSNSAPYFLLICDTANTPTPNAASSSNDLGTAPPDCSATSTVQWAVSASTTSGTQARAATTTLESFSESNIWYAWICDDDPVNPRCNAASKQGTGTTSSPFNVNHRPSIAAFSNDSPALPGTNIVFSATSSDTDTVDTADTMQLHVCSTNSFETSSSSCSAVTLATSTYSAGTPVAQTATYAVGVPFRDNDYAAYAFVIDEHGHVASASLGSATEITVSNAVPYVNGSDITLNNGSDLTLVTEAGETTGFEIFFNVTDDNSCDNTDDDDEITGYELSVFRSTIGSSSCDAPGDYDANNCYTSTVATTTWNLSCTASTTSCTFADDGLDRTQRFDCTFPLWYIADPTDGGATNTVHYATDWSAAVTGVDDNNATGTLATSTIAQELESFSIMSLDTAAIPYGALEPGDRTDPLLATTTVLATGNVGIDQQLTGEAMCGTYTSTTTCPNSASSTIPETYQVFATSSVTYGTATSSGYILSSSTQTELELDVEKSTSTSLQAFGVTFWGIEVPSSITLAGAYTGENTFYVKVAEPADW